MKRNVKVAVMRDAAAHKARTLRNKIRLVEYVVEGDDIRILSGPYTGQFVRALFAVGQPERDYIVKNLCVRNDAEVLRIIGGLCGN